MWCPTVHGLRVSSATGRVWVDINGLAYVRHYSHRSQAGILEQDVTTRYLCLSALAALIEAVEQAEGASFVKGTLRITFNSVEGVMLLDPATVANLEILRNLRTGDAKQSLFGILNLCKTAAGTRYLRSSLMQPSTNLETISARLDCVSELLEGEDALQDIQKVLPAFADSDRLLKILMQKPTTSGCARAKQTITAMLQLRSIIRSAPLLAAALTSNGERPLANELLRAIVANLSSPELQQMEERIASEIDPEATFAKRTSQRMLECIFALRPKAGSFLVRSS